MFSPLMNADHPNQINKKPANIGVYPRPNLKIIFSISLRAAAEINLKIFGNFRLYPYNVEDIVVKNNSTVNNSSKATGFGLAWILLCLTLAVHVVDEAVTDFLGFYNPAVESIRQNWPYFQLPTFTFPVWLALLLFAVVSLSILSPFAFGKPRRMKILAWAFGIVMLVNGILHIAISVYMGKAISGVYTSPLVLIFSIYLLLKIRNG